MPIKKIFLIFIAFYINTAHADEYRSLYGGTLLNNLTNNSSYRLYTEVILNKLAAGDPTNGVVYYPNGWTQFKLYAPGGMFSDFTINILPNSTARMHIKYNNESDTATQTVDHQNASGYLDPTGVRTAEMIVTDAISFSINNSTSKGGWLYVDIVSDCAHFACQYNPGVLTLRVSQDFYKINENAYAEWINTTNFLSPGGDPSANNQWMNIIDVSAPNTPSTRRTDLDYGGNPSSYSPLSSSSAISMSSSLSSTASFSSEAVYSSASSTTQTCPAGTTWNGWNCASNTSSSVYASSSTASSAASSCVSSGTSLPGPGGTTSTTCVPVSSSSIASSSSSIASQSCNTGYIKNSFGICVLASSLSSSSSSSSLDANVTSVPMTINQGWNFIAIPIETKETIDLNTTFSSAIGPNGYGYKFKFITDANQSYEWIPWSSGTSGTLSPGEGIFLANLSGQESTATFSAVQDKNSTKFNTFSFIPNKWYTLGFGYNLYVSDIKALYPNSAIWTLDSSGSYKKEDNNSTLIEKGKGFWFKRYE